MLQAQSTAHLGHGRSRFGPRIPLQFFSELCGMLSRKGLPTRLQFRAKVREMPCKHFLVFVTQANGQRAQRRWRIFLEGCLGNPSHLSNSSCLPACDFQMDCSTQGGKRLEEGARSDVPETTSNLRHGFRIVLRQCSLQCCFDLLGLADPRPRPVVVGFWPNRLLVVVGDSLAEAPANPPQTVRTPIAQPPGNLPQAWRWMLTECQSQSLPHLCARAVECDR